MSISDPLLFWLLHCHTHFTDPDHEIKFFNGVLPMETTVKHLSRQKFLIAEKTGNGVRVHQVKINTNSVRTERKLSI